MEHTVPCTALYAVSLYVLDLETSVGLRDACCAAYMNYQNARSVLSAGPHSMMPDLGRDGQVPLYHKYIQCRFYIS